MTEEPTLEQALKMLQARLAYFENKLAGAEIVLATLFSRYAERTGSTPAALAAEIRSGLDRVVLANSDHPARKAWEAADRILHRLEHIDELSAGDPDRSLYRGG